MIGEIGGGSSFRGLTHYLVHGRRTDPREPAWLEARNLFSRTPERVHQEMAATAAQNPRVERPVFHLMISPAAEDRLEAPDWRALADRVLQDLGLGEHQALVVLHTNTETPHLHIAVNRVHPETSHAWGTWRSKTRLEGILRAIESEWGLRPVPGRLAGPEREATARRLGPSLTVGEQAELRHRAEEPQVLRWRKALQPHLDEARSWTDLAARLKAHGLRLAPRGRGLVVTDGERFVKASRLARNASRARLEARFDEGFSAWRESLARFRQAATLHPRYLALSPGHPRATATARVLRRTGRRLGWRALGHLLGPTTPAVASLALPARRRAPEPGDGATWDTYARRHLAPALARARSWAEAEGRLRLYGAWVAQSSGGDLVVTDGEHRSPLDALRRDFSRAHLDARLGPWSAWERSRRAIHHAVNRYAASLEQADHRAERWTRVVHVIRTAEHRLERFEALKVALEDAAGSLRRTLRGTTPRAEPAQTEELLRRLRQARGSEEAARYLAAHSPRRLGGLVRQKPHPDLLAVAERYRQLASALRRQEAPARSAARRLATLRRRAQLLSASRATRVARTDLVALVRPILGVGVRSLIARAAPGLGPALSLLRVLRPRSVERDRGNER